MDRGATPWSFILFSGNKFIFIFGPSPACTPEHTSIHHNCFSSYDDCLTAVMMTAWLLNRKISPTTLIWYVHLRRIGRQLLLKNHATGENQIKMHTHFYTMLWWWIVWHISEKEHQFGIFMGCVVGIFSFPVSLMNMASKKIFIDVCRFGFLDCARTGLKFIFRTSGLSICNS